MLPARYLPAVQDFGRRVAGGSDEAGGDAGCMNLLLIQNPKSPIRNSQSPIINPQSLATSSPAWRDLRRARILYKYTAPLSAEPTLEAYRPK